MATSPLPAFSALYAFGDSLSDAGNLSLLTALTGTPEPVSPPYFQENYGLVSGTVFSNGPTWAQDLAKALGLPTLSPSLLGGNDFAYGGAETGATPQNANDTTILAISLPAQLAEFNLEVPKPSANALYTVSIGANDIFDILGNPGLTAQQQTADINRAVANEIAFLKSLVAEGATNLLVLGIPDLGKTPEVISGAANGTDTPSAQLVFEASALASAYNAALASQIAGVGAANVHVINAFQLIDNAVANPSEYGLTNVTAPVWSGDFTSDGSGALVSTNLAVQDQYLFWDHLHPTETGEQAIALVAEQLLAGTAVSESAAAVSGNLDYLQLMVAVDAVTSITLTDGGTPTVTVSAAQLADDQQALGAIGSAFALSITGYSAAVAAFVEQQGFSTAAAYGGFVAGTTHPTMNEVVGFQSAAFSGGDNAIVLDNPEADYAVSVATNGQITIKDIGAADATDGQSISVSGASYVVFNGAALAAATGTTTILFIENATNSAVAALYTAALGREPDLRGLAFWENAIATGTSMTSLAQFFLTSSEFTQRYPAAALPPDDGGPNDAAFVTAVYQNVLGRAPDSGGLSYWIAAMAGGFTRADILESFAGSGENMNDISAANGGWLVDTATGAYASATAVAAHTAVAVVGLPHPSAINSAA
jgi:phospholipase/lecithinase/hemolysin